MSERLVIISERDLDNLIFKASRSANDQLFKGLLPFLNRLFDENEIIFEEMKYLKSFLQQGFTNKADKPNEIVEVKKESPVKVNNPDVNPKLAEFIKNMSDEDKELMAQRMKEAIQSNSIVNNVHPVKLPKLKGDE